MLEYKESPYSDQPTDKPSTITAYIEEYVNNTYV